MSGFTNIFAKTEEIAHRGVRNAFGVETHKLADVRAGKAYKYIVAIDNEVQRLAVAKNEGLVMAKLSVPLAELDKEYRKAAQLVLADQKNEAMEPVKVRAEQLAEKAPEWVSNFLKVWDVVDEQRMKARFLVKLAKQQPSGAPGPGKPDLSYLTQPAKDIAKALDTLEAQKTTDCEAAVPQWTAAYDRVSGVIERFRDEQLTAPLAKQAQDAAAADPKGPEATMQRLFSDLPKKMANTNLTALATGADISVLNPALGAAIAEYTTSAYIDINSTLLGIPGTRTQAREAQCKDLAKVVQTAMERLANFDGWPTNRGEKPWKGSEAQYKERNVFILKAFWSTGVGFKFDGSIQIAVTGKKGSKGKDVAAFSRFPNEREVLFPPGTKFEVVSNKTKDDVTHIRVREV